MASSKQTLVAPTFAVVNSTVQEANRKALQPILAGLISLSLDVKQLHWNVVGPNFRAVHLQLDEIYALVQDSIDSVAERLSTTGHSPQGTAKTAAEADGISLPQGFIQDRDALELASVRVKETANSIRDLMAPIEDVDTVTADLLHTVCDGLEKQHWMLRAALA